MAEAPVHFHGEVLTAPGKPYALDEKVRDMVCLLDDGRLFVSKTHMFNPYVSGFISRLKRSGIEFRQISVDMSVIAGFYERARATGNARASSERQADAKSLFERAVKVRASDIHIRVSSRSRTQILFRIHNDLEFQEEHSFEYGDQLCTAIYQSMTNVSDTNFEPMKRQDGRISDPKNMVGNLDGIRIATSPQVDGFVMVLRLLYNDAADAVDLTALGYNGTQNDALELMKRRPTGINLIGGPTGSGKSTTLQRVLSGLIKDSKGRKHVITVEDPPEYPIPGASQTPVTNADTEEERSKQFQAAIKAAMRLDPDVMMISEVRDGPSAQLAVRAAMTGHQVWTTIHVNNAFAIIDRLVDLGVPLNLVTDPTIVTGLTCQRLLQVLCPNCKVPLTDDGIMERYRQEDLARVMQVVQLSNVYVHGEGCAHCGGSGIVGRTVVAETVITDQQLMSYLRLHDRIGAIEYWKRDQKGRTMLDHAIEKIAQGTVDPFNAETVVGPLTMGKIEQDFRIDPEEVRNVVQ